jgi:choline dehydrogenase-like flavoprotein
MNLVPYRVLNTIGLRVIDASIFPLIPNANINVPAMATGCQGADFMLEQWNLQ